MQKYIRKLFPHDLTHEISITKQVYKSFFDEKEKVEMIGKVSKLLGNVTFNNVTDLRFGGDLEKIIKSELLNESKQVDDFIIISKLSSSSYELEYIKGESELGKLLLNNFLNDRNNRHLVFYEDNNESIELTESQYEYVNPKIDKPYQRIFFGAPGTGKSYNLNKEAKEYFANNYERVTFHPNYMYGNFVGTFKPFPKLLTDKNNKILKDEHGNTKEQIVYKYVPGVFIKILIKAYKNPNQNYLLLIEEINRANVAAVFGDIFQLLDRGKNGESEYSINISEELRIYFKEEFSNTSLENNIIKRIGSDFTSIILPSNLYIWCTMNSADQGVMPMDTAFRRRWDFKYISIDEAVNDNFDKYMVKISPNEEIKWNDFRVEINNRLSLCNIPEDKLIGPYFISKSILESYDSNKITQAVIDKVLIYLYEDAVKAYKHSFFAENKANTYSMLCENFKLNAKTIFRKNLELKAQQIKTISN